MRRALILFLLLLLLLVTACASRQSQGKSGLAEPEIVIEQLSVVPPAARGVNGPLSLHYRVHVHNAANATVTLRRIDINSIGYGSYEVGPSSRPFNVQIKPGSESQVELWVPGQIVDPSLTGANGPVTLRAVAFFDSPAGALQTVVTQQVRPRGGD